MSLISDVNREAAKLDFSAKNLRKFGLVVGGVFLLIFGFLAYKDAAPVIRIFCGGFGVLLVISGALFPVWLEPLYRFWMRMALMMGWVVSRILLSLIFFLVLTPIGLLAKLLGKDFLNIHPKNAQDSYWIQRDKNKVPNYERLH